MLTEQKVESIFLGARYARSFVSYLTAHPASNSFLLPKAGMSPSAVRTTTSACSSLQGIRLAQYAVGGFAPGL